MSKIRVKNTKIAGFSTYEVTEAPKFLMFICLSSNSSNASSLYFIVNMYPTLLQLCFKVMNHLVKFRGLTDLILLKNCNFCGFHHYFTHFLLIFGLFWTSMTPSSPQIHSKYVLPTLLQLYFKVINHLVKFQGFSDLILLKNCNFRVFQVPKIRHYENTQLGRFPI